ncbi:MAG: hypothetical protein J6T10_27825 [Methanobrevibacter sp.]|nr:hypothetical protein [Methanobrevibacter sp.]
MDGILLGTWEIEVKLLPQGMLNLWVRRENNSGLEYSNIPFELAGDCIMSDVLDVIENLEE